VVVERDAEEYYIASGPALPGCHTQARSLDKLMVRICEAIVLFFKIKSTPARRVTSVKNNFADVHPDIRRLTGLAPADWDAKVIDRQHLAERHA